jgi:hypothetical protein
MIAAVSSEGRADTRQEHAEQTFWHRSLVGGAIGMVLGALLWAGIVAVALVGSGNPLGPVVWMGAGVGVFGGIFLGGWAGAMSGLRQLEETEREILTERNARH